MDMKISQAFPGMAAPARRSLATMTNDWSGLVELARVAREEGPSEILNQIAASPASALSPPWPWPTSSTSRTIFRSSPRWRPS